LYKIKQPLKTKLLLFFISLVLLSCNTRYVYRAKIKVNSNKPIAKKEATLSIDSTFEATTEDHYQVISTSKLKNIEIDIDSIHDKSTITPLLDKQSLGSRLRSSKNTPNIFPQNKKTNKPADFEASEKASRIAGIMLVGGTLFILLGLLHQAQQTKEMGISPFIVFGIVFILFAFPFFIIALILRGLNV
jgi:hypothetical protein